MDTNSTVEKQEFDADCNDCKYFKRGMFIQLFKHKSRYSDYFEGVCLKYNKDTKAYPNSFSGKECFVHRKR